MGPLHYLTEINWLKERNYFSKNKNVFWIMLAISIFISASPVITALSHWNITESYFDFWTIDHPIRKGLMQWSPTLIFGSIIAAVCVAFIENIWIAILAAVGAMILGFFLQGQEFYIVWLGVFTPTLIHVYIFTLLFMLYGALKTKSTPGIFAVMALIFCAFIIFTYSFKKFEIPSELTLQRFDDSTFKSVSERILQYFGMKSKIVGHINVTFIRIQSFIAFAYTYHYLNWFSKTSIIKWYETDKKQLIFIGIIWVSSVVLYYYDYHAGLTVLFLLSFMHVLLEFPLNVVSIKGIINIARRKEK